MKLNTPGYSVLNTRETAPGSGSEIITLYSWSLMSSHLKFYPIHKKNLLDYCRVYIQKWFYILRCNYWRKCLFKAVLFGEGIH